MKEVLLECERGGMNFTIYFTIFYIGWLTRLFLKINILIFTVIVYLYRGAVRHNNMHISGRVLVESLS